LSLNKGTPGRVWGSSRGLLSAQPLLLVESDHRITKEREMSQNAKNSMVFWLHQSFPVFVLTILLCVGWGLLGASEGTKNQETSTRQILTPEAVLAAAR
jgi:hypothetical protein